MQAHHNKKEKVHIQVSRIHALFLISLLKERNMFFDGLFLNKTGKRRRIFLKYLLLMGLPSGESFAEWKVKYT